MLDSVVLEPLGEKQAVESTEAINYMLKII